MKEIQLDGATVPFHMSEEEGVVSYHFNSSLCSHPEPMINAMVGLGQIKAGEKLIMINSKAPAGLFPKIENDFSYEVKELSSGKFEITFMKKGNGSSSTDFNDKGCGGGSCSN
ncbi:MAG: hypothetical protein AUK54_09665 [Helicobacteraceae bacterium CG2_30_36_10]|nr:MAG: hypothetical protein AUK54_09665 [Helicobacteraceae bacterium CG2_30_36_10]